jgi:hypothetical protein
MDSSLILSHIFLNFEEVGNSAGKLEDYFLELISKWMFIAGSGGLDRLEEKKQEEGGQGKRSPADKKHRSKKCEII